MDGLLAEAEAAGCVADIRARLTGKPNGLTLELFAGLSSLGHDAPLRAMFGLLGSVRIKGAEPAQEAQCRVI